MSRSKRGNGSGSLFQRAEGGPWYASWFGGDGKRKERSTRTTSRADAERIMRKWVERAVLEREGLVKPEGGTELDRHAAALIASHLDAFDSAKRAEGRTDRHINETRKMIEKAAEGCDWKTLGDLSPEALERFIGRQRAPDDGSKAWTPRTANKYITALRAFARWCVSDGRLAADPLARVKKPAPTRQRERRFLAVDEWRWLKATTDHGTERMGMDGHARRLLYELAIQTGLRSGELRSLTRSSLMLESQPPYILLEARQTKNRKAARQYVRSELARELAEFVSSAMPGAAVFAMPRREHVAKMFRADLESAREAWLAEAGTDAVEQVTREGSAFLRAEDHDGRVLDFHALRHTSGAWAAIGGASPKAIQTLMRHSAITLTLDTYGHLLPDEASETVARMPSVEPIPLRLTGTTDEPEARNCLQNRVPATSPATGAQRWAMQCDEVRQPSAMKNPAIPAKHAGKRGFQTERKGFEPPMTQKAIPDFESGTPDRKHLINKTFTQSESGCLATGPATAHDSSLSAAQLATLIDAWPNLPEAIRTGIAAMVAAADPKPNGAR